MLTLIRDLASSGWSEPPDPSVPARRFPPPWSVEQQEAWLCRSPGSLLYFPKSPRKNGPGRFVSSQGGFPPFGASYMTMLALILRDSCRSRPRGVFGCLAHV